MYEVKCLAGVKMVIVMSHFNAVLNNRGSLSSDEFHAADRRLLIAVYIPRGKEFLSRRKVILRISERDLGNVFLAIKI